MKELENEMLKLAVYSLLIRGEGEDLLMGRNVKYFIHVDGLESFIYAFILDLDTFFEKIYENDVKGFLKLVEDKFSIRLSDLDKNLSQNITQMQAIDSDEVMIYYLVITKLLETLRETMLETSYGWDVIGETIKEIQNKPATDKQLDHLEELNEQDQEDLSLLYNLLFTHFLAKTYKNKKMLTELNKIIKNHVKNTLFG